MKKSELRKVIRSIIAEQLGPAPLAPMAGPSGTAGGGNEMPSETQFAQMLFQAIGSPKTYKEAGANYARWCRNASRGLPGLVTPREAQAAFNKLGATGQPPTPSGIWPLVGAIAWGVVRRVGWGIGGAYLLDYLGGSGI